MLIDSNIIIYAAQPGQTALRQFIQDNEPAVSVVSYVETLGYHQLDENEKRFLEAFFAASEVLPITDGIVKWAVMLRQRRRMSLGDALIAGSALAYERILVTHNVDDFAWIKELTVIDPVDG